MRVLGFMSGTSLDGVDAAILETDGKLIFEFGPAELLPFTTAERKRLVEATEAAVEIDAAGGTPEIDREAEAVVTAAHIRAAELVLRGNGHLDLIGFHGQTVLHRPDRHLSVQLGDPAALARAIGVPVIASMRQADLDRGGQGAPIVPAYHAAVADKIGVDRPVAFLNIGGVANVTWLGSDGTIVAFDTGPGNGMIDLMVQARNAGRYDDAGRLAAQGKVDREVVQSLLASSYFNRPGPKSLDRYDFPLASVDHLSIEDAAATLTAFTVESVAVASEQLPEKPRQWLVCGGGRHNPTLMGWLAGRLGDCRSVDNYGLRGDFIEAEAMAFLAARSQRGLPLTFPGTTGVAYPTTGGRRWDPVEV